MTSVDRADFDGRGFLRDAVLGTRSFKVQDGGWLSGIVHEQVWDNTGLNESMCLKGEDVMKVYWPDEEPELLRDHPDHPFEPCSCGFYGFFEGSNDWKRDAPVWGVIEAFGELVIGRRGFRAKKARLHAIVINVGRYDNGLAHSPLTEDKADLIRLNYWNIPEFATFEEMITAFPPGSPELDTLPAYTGD